jgi:hypothetical protein
MQLKWYFLQKGQPIGPFSRDELIQKIHAKHIGPLDLLFRDDQAGWRPALEFDELLGQWQGEIPPVEPPKWVLLLKQLPSEDRAVGNEPLGAQYKQRGPFSTQEILDKIKDQSVSVSDFIWAPGYTQWYSIYSVPTFQNLLGPAAPDVSSTTNLPVESSAVVSVVAQQDVLIAAAPSIEEAPATLNFDDIKTVVAEKPSITVRPGKFDVKGHGVRSRKMVKSQSWFWRFGYPVVIFLFGALFVFCLLFVFKDTPLLKKYLVSTSKKATSSKAPEAEKVLKKDVSEDTFVNLPTEGALLEDDVADEPIGEAQAGGSQSADPVKVQQNAGDKKKDAALAQMNPKPVEIKKNASYLKVRKGNEGRATAYLIFDTDASSHMPLELHFWSERAQVVSEGASYWRSVSIDGKKGRKVSVAELKLPNGYLYFEGIVNEQSVRSVLDIGSKEKGYANDLLLHRKGLVARHQEERFLLIRLLGRLDKALTVFFDKSKELQVSKTNKQWMSFYNGWKKSASDKEFAFLLKVNNKNRNGYIHARIWLDAKAEFQAIAPVLKSIHSGDDEEKLEGMRDLRDIMRSVRDLKGQAQDATLF